MNSLSLMELEIGDFDWYDAGLVADFVDRKLPQLFGELAINNEPLTVHIIDNTEVPDYDEVKVAFVFKGQFLPLYENGDFYVKPNGLYATLKRNDGCALIGIRNES